MMKNLVLDAFGLLFGSLRYPTSLDVEALAFLGGFFET